MHRFDISINWLMLIFSHWTQYIDISINQLTLFFSHWMQCIDISVNPALLELAVTRRTTGDLQGTIVSQWFIFAPMVSWGVLGGTFNLLLQLLNQGHTVCFLVVLNQSTLKQKYTPHTHCYGLKKKKTPVPCQIYNWNAFNFKFLSQYYTLYTSQQTEI